MWVYIALSIISLSYAFTPISTQRQRSSSFITNSQEIHTHTSTKLHLFQYDENVSERIKSVQQNWDSIKATGIKEFIARETQTQLNSLEKILVQEIISAEKTVEKSFLAAEKAAELAIAEDLKQGFATKNMIEAVDAAKALAQTASMSAMTESNAVSELSDAADGVKDTIQEAMKVVQLVADKASQEVAQKTEGFTYLKSLDTSMVAKLESSISDIQTSIKTAESISDAVSNAAAKDVIGLDKLESTSGQLIKSFDKIEDMAEQEVVSNSLSAKLVTSLEKAASTVIDELKSVEDISSLIAKAARDDADAVASFEDNASNVIEAIQAVESAIKNLSNDPSSLEKLKTVATEAVAKIKADEAAISVITKAVENDALNDAKAITMLQSADVGLSALIQTMEDVTNDFTLGVGIEEGVRVVENAVQIMQDNI